MTVGRDRFPVVTASGPRDRSVAGGALPADGAPDSFGLSFASSGPVKSLVILGGGTGGTMIANRMARALAPDWGITVIDANEDHLYQPGLLFLPFAAAEPPGLVRKRSRYLDDRVKLLLDRPQRVAPRDKRVVLSDGQTLSYDVLVIATGSEIQPSATPGLAAEGWMQSAFDFYSLTGARALRSKLSQFREGRLVLNLVDMPIKCPVAPLEFLFLADEFFRQRGVRDGVELVLATPLDGAFTKPLASRKLGYLLEEKRIRVEPDFAVESVDGVRRNLRSFDERSVDYDLLVSVPLHRGSRLVTDSEMGDDAGFVPTDPHYLFAKGFDDVFVLGDATDLPASKAGSVAHFQSEVLANNLLGHIEGASPSAVFDGHSNCFIETGFGQAMLIDFNYETEPLPGRFPLPGIGPFSLLKESKANHYGKLMFQWVYWNLLLPGHDLPIEHSMTRAGKWEAVA